MFGIQITHTQNGESHSSMFIRNTLEEICDVWIEEIDGIDFPDSLRKSVVSGELKLTHYVRMGKEIKICVRIHELKHLNELDLTSDYNF